MEVHVSDSWDGRMCNVDRKRQCIEELLWNVVEMGFSVLSAENPGEDVEASTRTPPAKGFCHFCQLDAGRVADDAAVLLLVTSKADDQLVPNSQIGSAWSPLSEDCDCWLDISTIQ